MTIKVHKPIANFTSVCEIIEPDSFRACSFAMDDGGRCLLDVISDPLLLQSFLESGSDDNSKDPQDGTSSESAVESPQIVKYPQVVLSNHVTSTEHVIEPSEQMGYSYTNESQSVLSQSTASTVSVGVCIGASHIVESPSICHQAYQHSSAIKAAFHHLPTSIAQPSIHQHSPISHRSHTPLSHNSRSPVHGSSAHSMPPPSPIQPTKSPLPSHTPSPAPSWSPAPPVLSPASSRPAAVPPLAFQPLANQLLQTTTSGAQIVTALTTQQSQKVNLQQQQLLLHPQLSPISSPHQAARLSMASPVVTTAAVQVTPSMVQIISAPQANVPFPIRAPHNSVRPIQPKLPQQILPKPTSTATNQFVTPVVKQANHTPVTASQRNVTVPVQAGATSQLVIGQGQPSMFSGPQGTILLNSIIPGVGQNPILIQGNLSNLANLQGLQLTLRPPVSATTSQTLSSSGAQNNPTLIAALQSPNQPAHTLFTQAKNHPLHGQPTIVIPNNLTQAGLAQQNLNLANAAIRNNTVGPPGSQGQGFLTRSNIILSPRVLGPNQGFQLQQIQTPQGPILALAPSGTIALPTALQNATLGPPHLGPGGVPVHSVVAGHGVISGLSLQSHPSHAALHQHSSHQPSVFSTAVSLASHVDQSSQPIVHLSQAIPSQLTAPISVTQQPTIQLQHHETSPKPNSPRPSKVPSVNLEELLKEHGIVPENTPPPSPDSQSPQTEEALTTHLQMNNPIVQSPQLIAALQSQQVVLEQLPQSPLASSLPQMKLALAQDGSVILQPHNPFISPARYTHGPAVSKISGTINSTVLPTVTTSAVSVPVVTTQPCGAARNHSALLARLNSAPAISIPDVVTSLALTAALGSCTSCSITTSTITTTTPMLIPLTVQSLSISNSPSTTNHVIQPVTSVSSVISGQIPIELCSTLPQSVNHTTSGAVPTVLAPPNVQNRLNHVFFGFQPLISSTQHQSVVETVSKTLENEAGSLSNSVITSYVEKPNSQKSDSQVVGECDINNGTPSHKHPSSTAVPNDVIPKLQKEVSDLLTLKIRTPEQQKTLQQLLALQQNLGVSPKLSYSQVRQMNQVYQQVCNTDIENENHSTSQKPLVSVTVSKSQPNIPSSSSSDQKSQITAEKPTILFKSNASQSIHLVNLLKQTPVHNNTLRPIVPVCLPIVCQGENVRSTSNGIQLNTQNMVGNQLNNITIIQQKHQVSNQLMACDNSQLSKDNPNQLSQQSVQQTTTNAQKHPSVVIAKAKPAPPVIRINSAADTALINKQLAMDQNSAVNPDTKTPFSSKHDACQRLMKYHVYNSKVPSLEEMNTADEMFEKVSIQLLDKFCKMINKYHLLQLKESMRPCATPEQVLLERLFQGDEKSSLEKDKAEVADGKSLDLPPVPSHWMEDFDCGPSCSAQNREQSASPCKEDFENLEAPVIDSCIDVTSPQSDVCDRSPPTLKRIVIKTEYSSDAELEESHPKKRLKINSSIKLESSTLWSSDSSKVCEKKGFNTKDSSKIQLKCHKDFHSASGEDDIMTKLRKELNISPLENDDDDDDDDNESVVPHVDFEPPSCTNGLADFDAPIASTDRACDSTLLTNYSNCARTNVELKYDFDMLDCPSEWVEAYANHSQNATESEAAVESILNDHQNASELDLSGIEGLDDNLDDSQQSIPNGICDNADESRDSELPYISYHIPKTRSFRDELDTQIECHTNEMQDQVQSAIKSILELQSQNCSYFDGEGSDVMPRLFELGKPSHDTRKRCRISPVSYVGLDGDIGVNSETDAALDEAVRSILQ